MVETTMGNFKLELFADVPLHSDNFLKLVNEGFYDSLLFHRVIPAFMIQGGDPQSKNAPDGQMLGNGDVGYRVPAEFQLPKYYHKKGALAAARDNNPEKASSNCQFYIVQRPAWRTTQLDSTIVQRKLTLNDTQKKLYTTEGGTPHLDGGYTVFGELITGFDVLDKIATSKTNPADRPLEDVRMKMFLLTEPKKLKSNKL